MICVINSGGANIASIQCALTRLGYESVLTTDKAVIQSASHVILPGVGSAQYAMARLSELALVDFIRQLTQPVLGICLGMQLLFDHSEEGDVDCLGIMNGRVTHFPRQEKLTIPHMGWNQLEGLQQQSPILAHDVDGGYCYFVHSYIAPVNAATVAVCHHGVAFAAIVNQANFYGMQFHPERSQETGRQLLRNFLALK